MTRALPTTPLVIAAHGTRDPEGLAVCTALVDRVRGLLPDVRVDVGYVELAPPSIAEALTAQLGESADQREAAADPSADLGQDQDAVVVPLMLNTGGHVRSDIPGEIAAAAAQVPGARIGYARPLGADPRLVAALQRRIRDAAADWDLRDTTLLLVGRGAAVPEANADHARLARLVHEHLGTRAVVAAYAQVTRPSLPEALNDAVATGARHIVVAAHLLFPGMLRTWLRQQAQAWQNEHPDVPVRVAEVIGDCDELAAVVVDRYREAAQDPPPAPADGAPVYLSGLLLADKDVLVVGAGAVADRRVPRLLQAGARVRLVSPTLSVRLRRLLGDDRLHWEQRAFTESDLDEVWYALALTNDPAVNARVAAAALDRRVFCVRADDARAGTAWTPAVESAGGLTVGVVGNRDPRRSVSVRDALLTVLQDQG